MAMHIFTGYVMNDFIFVIPYAIKYKLSDDIMFVAHHVTLIFTWTSFLTGDFFFFFFQIQFVNVMFFVLLFFIRTYGVEIIF
jgi:hypothetical protein